MLRNWKVWLGFAASAVAIYLTFRNVRFADLGTALAGARLVWFLPASLFLAATFGARAWRWDLLMGSPSFATTFHAMNIGYLLNIVLPLRLGEVGRAVVIGARTPLPVARAFSSIVVERLLDLGGVVALFGIVATMVPMPPAFARAAVGAGAFALLVLAATGLMLWQAARAERLLGAVLGRLTRRPEPWLQRFRDLCGGFRAVGSARRVLLVLALTVAIWVTGIAFAALLLGAFLAPRIDQASLVVVTANLGGALPSAPGGLGIVQGFATSALVIPFGVREDLALAYVLVWSLGQQLILLLLGLWGLGRIGMSFSQVRAGALEAPPAEARGTPAP